MPLRIGWWRYRKDRENRKNKGDREFKEFREFRERLSLNSLISLTSLNSLIYHLNQRTCFRERGSDLAYHEKFLVRSAKIWQQVEIALEGGVLDVHLLSEQ